MTRGETPQVWKQQAEADAGADPLAAWLAAYRAALRPAKPATPASDVRAAVVTTTTPPDSEDIFAIDRFADFWDDLDLANRLACRAWSTAEPVHVVELGGHFKFAEWDKDLAAAFPAAAWATFTVVDLGFTDVAIRRSTDGLPPGAFDLAAFRTYLSVHLPSVTVRP